MVKVLNEFLHQKEILKQLRRIYILGGTSLVLEFDKLLEFDLELAKNLIYCPTEFFSEANGILEEITKIPGMRLRVRGLDRTLGTKDIRAKDMGYFIQISGTVTSVGGLKFVKTDNPPNEFEDYQEIRIDDLGVVLTRDLVGKAEAGNSVIVTGILEAFQSSGFYEPRIIANHLEIEGAGRA